MSGTVSGGGFATPYQNPQFAPQGLFGNLLATIAGPAGSALGNVFGNQKLGSQISSTVGHLGQFLPFAAEPQQQAGQQQLDPQSLASIVAMIRQAAQAAQQGVQILDAVHKAAPGLLPFALGPDQQQQAGGQQIDPQGLFGSILGKVAGAAGGAIGGLLGHQQLGSRIGNTVGQFSHFLPFSAGPEMAGQQQVQQQDPQYAPQGLFGSILGGLAGPLGGAIGGIFGNQKLGSRIGGTAGTIANFLPFAAGPQQPGQVADGQQQMDPQSLATLVNIIRQAAQAAQQGLQILDAVHKAAPGLLPFALGPDQQQQQAGGQQIDPQGLFGSILGKVAGAAGGALGGLLGHQQLGARIGNTVGQFSHFLPFAAGPQMGNPLPGTLH